MTAFYSDNASWCSKVADTPITVYRPVSKTVLTTIDGTPTTTVELDMIDAGNSTVVSSPTMIEPGVAVFWREKDLSSFPESYASVLAKRFDIDYTPSGASTTSSNSVTSATPAAQSRTSASLGSPTSTPSSDPTPAPTTGLSTAAKAGIGIGAAILVLLLVLGALFLIKRRRKAKQHGAPELHGEDQKMMPELPGKDQAQCKGVVMVAHEMDGKTWKAELDAPQKVHELEGEGR
jgi:LPXTG-motif cell wall-anchored protein